MTVHPNDSRLYIGLDGGGTKTHVLLATERSGQLVVLGEGQGGPSNPRAVGFDAAFQSIEHTVKAAFASAQLTLQTVDRMILCLAGAGRAEEMLEIESWAVRSKTACQAQVISEAEAILEAHRPLAVDIPGAVDATLINNCLSAFAEVGEAEVALICGTGSLAWGRKTAYHSRFARSGGWGYLLGDEGSGFWIGQKLLQLACQSADGRAQEQALLSSILLRLELDSPMQLVQWCYCDNASRQRIAALAPLAFELPQSLTVQQVVSQAAEDLAVMVGSVAKQLETSNYRLAVAGSVIVHQRQFLDQVLSHLAGKNLSPLANNTIHRPAVGCVHKAMAGNS